MPKSPRKKRAQSVPKLSFQQKLLKIAKQRLQQKQRSSKNVRGIKIRLFDALPAINIYLSPKNEFVLAIKKSSKRIRYFTQDPKPQHYFEMWGLKLQNDDQQYFCILGKGPIVEGKTPFQSCREIINNLQTTAARSKRTQQMVSSLHLLAPLTQEESQNVNYDDTCEAICELF